VLSLLLVGCSKSCIFFQEITWELMYQYMEPTESTTSGSEEDMGRWIRIFMWEEDGGDNNVF
jgi:hypothetical protein